MLRTLIIFFTLFCCTTTTVTAEIEQFIIKSDLDSAYLPYSFEILRTDSLHSLSHPTSKMIKILQPAYSENDSTYFVMLNNPAIATSSNSWFSELAYPAYKTIDDDQVRSLVEDWSTYYDSLLADNIVVGVGRYNNSLELFKSPIRKEIPADNITLFVNKTDRKLTGTSTVCLIEDYDYDGNLEIFVYLNYNAITRTLYCIDLTELKIEWELEVSSPINYNSFFSCNNKENPSVIFTTINPGNGKNDANYNDSYSYLSIVNQYGKVIYNKLSGNYSYCTPLLYPDSLDNTFYFTHIENAEDIGNGNSTIALRKLSKIDNTGKILNSIPVSEKLKSISIADFCSQTNKSLFVNYDHKYYEVYDRNLQLIAVSDTTSRQTILLAVINISTENKPVYLIMDGLYNYDFEKILQFPFNCSSFEITRFDSLDNTVELLINARNKSYIGRISKKTNLELLSVFYHNNQLYILMAFSGLLVGLVITSIYQRKTKNNLNLITTQKFELEETHQQLKDTQQKLIEAEKYKQAKDIAGGFAHEIRNALFPVDGSLNKLFRLNYSEQYNRDTFDKYFEKIKKSTNRAISMTELISQCTKLDSQYFPEQVNILKVINEVLEANQTSIDEQQVEIIIEGDSDITVDSNYQQLFIVINNLMLNSLDALTNRESCHILIKWWVNADKLRLIFEDNGVGINSKNINQIFNTFFSTKPSKGTGIGLSIVKKIVEMYNGTIKVSSIENKKTTFEIMCKIHKHILKPYDKK